MTNDRDDIKTLADVERQHIEIVMKVCRGDRRQAAKMLDIPVRTLFDRLKSYGYPPARRRRNPPQKEAV